MSSDKWPIASSRHAALATVWPSSYDAAEAEFVTTIVWIELERGEKARIADGAEEWFRLIGVGQIEGILPIGADGGEVAVLRRES